MFQQLLDEGTELAGVWWESASERGGSDYRGDTGWPEGGKRAYWGPEWLDWGEYSSPGHLKRKQNEVGKVEHVGFVGR